MNKNNVGLDQVMVSLRKIFKEKAPAIPVNIKEGIVKYSPYITLIVLVLTLPAFAAVLGLGGMLTAYGYMRPVWGVSTIVALIGVVLEGLAIPGLMGRKKSGWNFALYAVFVGALGSLLGGNVIGMLISLALGLWVLFQVEEYYK